MGYLCFSRLYCTANEIDFIRSMKQHIKERNNSYVTENVIGEYLSKNYWEEKLIPVIGEQRTDIVMTYRFSLIEVFREKERVLRVGEKEEETSLQIINLAPNFMVKYGISATDFEGLIYSFVIGFERGSAAIVSNDGGLRESFKELGNIFRDYNKPVGIISRKEKDGFEILNDYK